MSIVPPFFAKPFGTFKPPKGAANWRTLRPPTARVHPASATARHWRGVHDYHSSLWLDAGIGCLAWPFRLRSNADSDDTPGPAYTGVVVLASPPCPPSENHESRPDDAPDPPIANRRVNSCVLRQSDLSEPNSPAVRSAAATDPAGAAMIVMTQCEDQRQHRQPMPIAGAGGVEPGLLRQIPAQILDLTLIGPQLPAAPDYIGDGLGALQV